MDYALTAALIFGIAFSLVGAGMLLKGPIWDEKVDRRETVSTVISSGQSFTHSIYLPRLDRALINLESTAAADIVVDHVYIANENVLWLQAHRGPFEFRHVYPDYSTTFRITITNPERLAQGSAQYTLNVSEYTEIPSGYESGSGIILFGILVAMTAAFKPSSISRAHNIFVKTKLIETTIRMSSICFSFLGLIIVELKLMAAVPITSFVLSGVDGPANLLFLLFCALVLSIFPLAVFSYFVSPYKIERRWKLRKAIRDYSLQDICNELSKKLGLRTPPQVFIIDSSATCIIFGNGIGKSKLVIGSGLKESLNEYEIRSVIAHELCHALHRDMIFITWGEVYLGYAKFWFAAIIGITILLISLNVFDDIGNLLMLSLFSTLGFLYSFYLINSISRDREYVSDLRATDHIDKTHLSSALIKVKKIAILDSLFSGSSLLFYSPLEDKVPSMFSTHPRLSSRLDVISGEWLPNVLSASTVIHVALIAGFSLPFFLNIAEIPLLNAGRGSAIALSIFITGIIAGMIYGLYFAYQKFQGFHESASLMRKFFMIFFSSLMSVYLGNTLAIAIFYAFALNFNIQQFFAVMLGGLFVFIVAFPVSFLFQYVFKNFLR